MKEDDKINPMTVEEAARLLADMLKAVQDTPNDTKLGRKIRKKVLDFAVNKYNIK